MVTLGQYLNNLVVGKETYKISEFPGEAVFHINSIKGSLFTDPIYKNYASKGFKSYRLLYRQYNPETHNIFEQVKQGYGFFEDTWIEVKRGNFTSQKIDDFQNQSFIDDPNGERLLLTLNW